MFLSLGGGDGYDGSCDEKDHEIHRQWVALVDDENPRDTGTQGYLQLSIAIVGPGDKLKVK